MDGLFALLPIENDDDFRNDEELFDKILFRRVIDRALLDIIGFPPQRVRKTRALKVNRYEQEALEWVSDLEEDSDFQYVCDLAGLDSLMVRRYIFKVKECKDKLSNNGKINIYKRRVKKC